MANAIASSSKAPFRAGQDDAHHLSREELGIVEKTAARFAVALDSDHWAVLRPDYVTPFTDTRDVIGRLLPYHVWNVPDRDLHWAIRQPVVASKYRKFAAKDGAEPARKRLKVSEVKDTVAADVKGKQVDRVPPEANGTAHSNADACEHRVDGPEDDEEPFPPLALCTSFLDRHAALLDQIQAARLRYDGAHHSAPGYDVQILQLERLAYQTHYEAYTREYRDLLDKRDLCFNAGMGTALQPVPQLRPTQTRPDIVNFESRIARFGPANRSWGSQSPGASSPQTHQQGQYVPRQGHSYSSQPTTPQAGRSGPPQQSSAVQIPKHPIPIIIPFSTLARLAAYDIRPVPAAHVRALLAPESLAIGGAEALPLIAPLAPRNDQIPSVMLMGITGPSTTTPVGGQTAEKNLHISVILSKLTSPQLSGLAEIMQSLQNANNRPAPPPPAVPPPKP